MPYLASPGLGTYLLALHQREGKTGQKQLNTAKETNHSITECLVGVWINGRCRVGDSGRHEARPIPTSAYNTGKLLVFLIFMTFLRKFVLDSLAECIINRSEMLYS